MSPSTLVPATDSATRRLVRLGGVPKVAGVPVLKALPELLRDQFAALLRWQRDYGGVFELDVGAASFLVVADGNAAGEMMVERHRTITRGGPLYEPMREMFGESILTTEGDVWRTRRRAMQPHFRQSAMKLIHERIDETIAQVLDRVEPGELDVEALVKQLTMAVGLRIMFGQSLAPERFETLVDALNFALGRIALGWVSSKLPRWFPLPGKRRYRRSMATVRSLIDDMVAARRDAGEYGDDLLAMLLHMADDGELSIEDIRNESIGLFSAGYETTANAIAWGLYELAQRPELQARVQAEADALARGELQSAAQLSYTIRVFKESMRMYPSAIWVPRFAAEDTELSGYPIKAGTAVLCSPYLVHHDPHAWDEPERFDPERFAPDSAQPRNRNAYMPFSLGPHMCVGLHLAQLEGPLALARMLARWQLAPIPGRPAIPKISTTMASKDGIWLALTRR